MYLVSRWLSCGNILLYLPHNAKLMKKGDLKKIDLVENAYMSIFFRENKPNKTVTIINIYHGKNFRKNASKLKKFTKLSPFRSDPF